jgi:NAD+ kinase
MNVAIFAKRINTGLVETLTQVISALKKHNCDIYLYKDLSEILNQSGISSNMVKGTFEKPNDISSEIKYFICIGGDGTFLQSIPFVMKKEIPLVGINNGRLGFLANIQKQEISQSIDAIIRNEFEIEHRSLIKLVSPAGLFGDFQYALNDLTIQKKGSSLITIHTYINNEYLNGYWTDGLIISTPTGSTAYSMSAGGPIVCPECKNYIISPIASHNFSVRPLVVDINSEISIEVEARNNQYLLTLDSSTIELGTDIKIQMKKAEFDIQTIKLKQHSFYNTIRTKLMWGMDPRN